jgi:hypothetical protein
MKITKQYMSVLGNNLKGRYRMKLLKYWFSIFYVFSLVTGLVKANEFDGIYTGSYDGTVFDNGLSAPVNGFVALIVTNGGIVVAAPGSGSGEVDLEGSAFFNGSGTSGDDNYTFDGTFIISPSGVATASGSWQSTSGNASGDGEWSATNEINITTALPTKVGNASATLNGSVITGGNAAIDYFQYGLDTTYGTTTSSNNVASGTGGVVTFSSKISDLAQNTVYHYQAVAIIDGITFYGNDQSIIQSVPPTLQITSGVNQANLLWATNNSAGYSLTSATNLVPPVTWSAVTNSPVVVGDQYLVTVPIKNRYMFFRLVQ